VPTVKTALHLRTLPSVTSRTASQPRGDESAATDQPVEENAGDNVAGRLWKGGEAEQQAGLDRAASAGKERQAGDQLGERVREQDALRGHVCVRGVQCCTEAAAVEQPVGEGEEADSKQVVALERVAVGNPGCELTDESGNGSCDAASQADGENAQDGAAGQNRKPDCCEWAFAAC
jgi:hypothetical protein